MKLICILLLPSYAAWLLFGGGIKCWKYRLTMYQRTSKDVANFASTTLQQDSLQETIQETLTTVANSPETLATLSALFQKLISEEGVRDAIINLLDACFQNPEMQIRVEEFLKDEEVQKSAGVWIQRALTHAVATEYLELKSAVLPPWRAKNLDDTNAKNDAENGTVSTENENDEDAQSEPPARNCGPFQMVVIGSYRPTVDLKSLAPIDAPDPTTKPLKSKATEPAHAEPTLVSDEVHPTFLDKKQFLPHRCFTLLAISNGNDSPMLSPSAAS